jgi:2OG-Fe(II) oxygenase superfamily
MADTISEKLHTALKKMDRPGVFASVGSRSAPNPGLQVEGLGTLSLPLGQTQAKELKAFCQQAPYGQGTKTIVDTTVRKVWELDPAQFTLENPAWDEFLQVAVAKVQLDLGLEKTKLYRHIYKLLLYEPGSFFLPHRDSEKLDRMVATMVVVLPSEFTGGELIVRHDGQERTFDFASAEFNRFDTHFAAFYADCEHEIRPLKTGYRLALVYNLTLGQGQKTLSAPTSGEHINKVSAILKNWPATEHRNKLVIPLTHQYTADGLTPDALKGVDRVQAQVLHEAAKLADCECYLTLLTYFQSGSAEEEYEPERNRYGRNRHRYEEVEDEEEERDDDGQYEMQEVIEENLDITQWSAFEGPTPLFGTLQVEEEEVVPEEKLLAVKPEEDYEGYTGNAGATLSRWYRHAAVVVWPKDRHFDVLCDGDSATVLGMLEKAIREWQTTSPTDVVLRDKCHAMAVRTLRHLEESYTQPKENERILHVIITLNDPVLRQQFLDKIVLKSRYIEDIIVLCKLCEHYGWLTFQKEILNLFQNPPQTKTSGSTERFLNLSERCKLLQTLCEYDSPLAKNNADRKALCVILAKKVLYSIAEADSQKSHDWRYSSDRGQILTLMTTSLLAVSQPILLTELLSRIRGDQKHYPLSMQIPVVLSLEPIWKKYAENLPKCVQIWLEKCLQDFTAIAKPEPVCPTDFRREFKSPCPCEHCQVASQFMKDPKQAVFRWPGKVPSRDHVEDRLRTSDVSFHKEKTKPTHTLVITKTNTEYEKQLKEHREDALTLFKLRELVSLSGAAVATPSTQLTKRVK